MGDRRFRDRRAAGRQLAAAVASLDLVEPLVLALPRGGVPVAYEVARSLDAPLEVFVARKLGAPRQPELGIGAIAEGGGRFVDVESLAMLGIDEDELRRIEDDERRELVRRVERYRHGRPLPPLAGRDVLLVDDGIATGVTARAALQSLRHGSPRRLILAAPVSAAATLGAFAKLADDVICLVCPEPMGAVGFWYQQFDQTTDDEVEELTRRDG